MYISVSGDKKTTGVGAGEGFNPQFVSFCVSCLKIFYVYVARSLEVWLSRLLMLLQDCMAIANGPMHV